MTLNTAEMPSFSNLGIHPGILSVLSVRKFLVPTPIQHQCIPAAIEGKDLVGIAQTGTGKTLAFGVPLIQRLAQLPKAQALILLPTRELALQVDEVLKKICLPLNLRTGVIIGGANMSQQLRVLQNRPQIIIATPGRLIDHLQQKTINLANVKIVVLDEADRMFDIGFMPQIKQILNLISTERQTLMFSATMPPAIAELASRYMKMPLRIEVAPAGTAAQNVEQEVFIVNKENKMQLLEKLLQDNQGLVLVFSRTKYGAKKITANLNSLGYQAAEIHSNRSLNQRKIALAGFKTGKYRVLVATDIAARGIDVKDISLVVNFDLPDNSEDYVHRIGRTGRAGSSGKAVSFATPAEKHSIKQIEKLIRKTLPIVGLPADLPAPAEPTKPEPAKNIFAKQNHFGKQSHFPARHHSHNFHKRFGSHRRHR